MHGADGAGKDEARGSRNEEPDAGGLVAYVHFLSFVVGALTAHGSVAVGREG